MSRETTNETASHTMYGNQSSKFIKNNPAIQLKIESVAKETVNYSEMYGGQSNKFIESNPLIQLKVDMK